LLGVGVIATVALVTLPLVGLTVWGDWLAQIR